MASLKSVFCSFFAKMHLILHTRLQLDKNGLSSLTDFGTIETMSKIQNLLKCGGVGETNKHSPDMEISSMP